MMNLAKGITGIFVTLQLLLCMPMMADEATSMQSNKVCGPECKCGCAQGAPCTCGPGMIMRNPPHYESAKMCGPECKCGCNEGAPCTCGPGMIMRNPPHYESEKVCGPECKCGCAQGAPCTCKPGMIMRNPPHYEPEEQQQPQYQYYQPSEQYYDPQYPQYEAYEYQTDGCEECCETCLRRPVGIDINGYMVVYEQGCRNGIWLPEDPPLFRPFMADPRQVTFSAGWRFNDNALTKNNIDVSYGDNFPIYRWLDVGPWHGQLEVDIEGALWAVFNPCYDSAPLINADYYGGMYIAYAIPNWQFRLRGYHISSHIGDEFLLVHPHFVRKNPSAEYLDFFISHDLTEEIRVYGGLGWVVAQDASFHFNPFYSALGAELRLLTLGFIDSREMLYGCPIFGMHFRQSGDFKKHVDATYVLGYELGKLTGLFRRWRVFMEYHDGYSLEGQFCKTPTDYFSVRTSYGF